MAARPCWQNPSARPGKDNTVRPRATPSHGYPLLITICEDMGAFGTRDPQIPRPFFKALPCLLKHQPPQNCTLTLTCHKPPESL